MTAIDRHRFEESASIGARPLEIQPGSGVRRPRAEPKPDAVTSGSTDAGATRPRVLVVENNPDMNRFVAETLGAEFDVVTAADGRAGLEEASRADVDLIVTALMLPCMSGDQMIAAIRERRELDRIPILILTARADDALRVRLLRDGAQDYVVKPISAEELRARAVNLVQMKRTRDVLQAEVTSRFRDLEALARQVAVEKQRAEEAHRKAAAASRAKDEFLAVLSHELRTPLNAILGWTSVLRREGIGPAERRHGLEVIDRNVRAQARLIEDLLDVSAMIRGRIRLRLDPVALRPVLAGALDAVRPAAEAKRIGIHWHCDDGDHTVLGDVDRLRQVFYNLLGNAIKFTPEDGQVMVQVGLAEDAIVISVEDTGVGIAPEFLPYVFDRFAQADSSPARRYAGLGLGLAIVRHLVELHGGTVRVESPGEGRGATFTVRLPAVCAREERRGDTAATSPEPVPSAPLLGLRVLFVEDDPDSREVVTCGLAQHGAIVASAATVGEAEGLLDRFQPDLLLSDIGLPEADGYALIQLVQSRGRRIPAIALTAYARPEDRQSALSAGYWRHIGKPVDIGELVATISTVAGLERGGRQ